MATEIHLLYIEFDCESDKVIGAFDDRERADRECAALTKGNRTPGLTSYRVDTVDLLSGCDAFNAGRYA